MRRRKVSDARLASEPLARLTARAGGPHGATAYFCREVRPPARADPARALNSRAMAQADLTRERLVRAALELFTAQGYHHTTTPAIAKKAGVAEGTIYRHFAGKQQFFNELYRASARWADKLVKDADALKVGPREKLAELARGLVAGAAREPAVAQLFFVQRSDALLDEESRKTAREFRIDLEGLIAQAKADGSVKPGAAEIWAGVWLAVGTLAIERGSARDWEEGRPAGREGVRRA